MTPHIRELFHPGRPLALWAMRCRRETQTTIMMIRDEEDQDEEFLVVRETDDDE